ncbi:hypothetical protein RUM43_006596, partial [Polyplax serrata]
EEEEGKRWVSESEEDSSPSTSRFAVCPKRDKKTGEVSGPRHGPPLPLTVWLKSFYKSKSKYRQKKQLKNRLIDKKKEGERWGGKNNWKM